MARLQPIVALFAALLLGSGTAHAGQFEQFGDYQVHYSIFPSSFLTAEVASRYGIARSKTVGIVNVSILRQGEQGRLEPVSGQVEGQVVNDVQQRRVLGFRRISEGNAVYYIAEFPFSEGELLTFELQANAPGAPGNMPVRVAQTLMND
ncbi:DUF4426 domain-containing protein [Marinobacter halodurans]|uniref:DUF4426 domain-containing protein n=2 Tax=Marinobacter halodurans TaxID=2528979 RepID=A0ABY1ZK11_9GAMM|nr:DUF4426 domain-containing protein [Marinobacter halodurans]